MLTAILVEVAPPRIPLANCIVMLVATLCERFVKVTTPPIAVRLVLPCNAPLPAPRLALTTVASVIKSTVDARRALAATAPDARAGDEPG